MIPHHFSTTVNVSPSLRGGLQADEAISEIASASFGTLPRNPFIDFNSIGWDSPCGGNDNYLESGGG